MSSELIRSIIADALKDSFMIFAFVFLAHFLVATVEEKLTKFLTRNKNTAPVLGSLFGLVPQCGTSILGADLYLKRYISMGTLIAIFLSCSDEAFIVMITNINEKSIMIFPLLASKFVIGFIVGIIFDKVYTKQEHTSKYVEDHHCHQHHDHENDGTHKYLIHPLIHSLEIFLYALIINLALGFIIGGVGEDAFKSFMISNRYLSPLYTSIIGLIPNCASSLLITELYMSGSLAFGALLAGLLVNSGLGMLILIKSRHGKKDFPFIISTCFVVSIFAGYVCCLIFGFS